MAIPAGLTIVGAGFGILNELCLRVGKDTKELGKIGKELAKRVTFHAVETETGAEVFSPTKTKEIFLFFSKIANTAGKILTALSTLLFGVGAGCLASALVICLGASSAGTTIGLSVGLLAMISRVFIANRSTAAAAP